jgi:hypothetical protein
VLAGVEPAQANDLFVQSTPVSEVESYAFVIPAQQGGCTVPIHGQIGLRYSGGPIIHEALLVMRGCMGVLFTRFFNPQTNQAEMVRQSMRLQASAEGTLLLGYNPVYADSGTAHPSYHADNFLFRQGVDGSWNIANCDDAMVCSPVQIVEVRS